MHAGVAQLAKLYNHTHIVFVYTSRSCTHLCNQTEIRGEDS